MTLPVSRRICVSGSNTARSPVATWPGGLDADVAGGVKALDVVDAGAVGHDDLRGVDREAGAADDDVAGEGRLLGAFLDDEAVGGDLDRLPGVVSALLRERGRRRRA